MANHSFTRRLSTQLLRRVFLFYVIIATSLTIGQMVLEYHQGKDEIGKIFESFKLTFVPSISKAVWNMNDEQIASLSDGIISLDTVLAIKINDADEQLLYSKNVDFDSDTPPPHIFFRELPLITDNENIGAITFYSSNAVVLKKVKASLIILLISSLIKTLSLWILVTWVAKNLITNPLTILTNALKNLDFSDTQTEKINLKLKHQNELSIVEASFNTMHAKLHETFLKEQRLLKKLKEFNTNLEDTIAIRTKDLAESHKNIKDSINYASLIQQAILPHEQILQQYCHDSFSYWQPKDVVGGDIFFVTELESSHEILIMVIDGAGHGVPGAFVTMLVKAIETQILADLSYGKLEPSPAKILAYFNQTIKTMLKQEKGSQSNAGFDGGILYYNAKTKLCKYAGAKTPLYIINNGELDIIKSDRKNVGYVRTKIDQAYTDYTIDIKANTKLYITTDGLIDQEGKNDSQYGKTRFKQFILDHSQHSFSTQKENLKQSFKDFSWHDENNQLIEQRDDVTVLGLQFNHQAP